MQEQEMFGSVESVHFQFVMFASLAALKRVQSNAFFISVMAC